MPKRRLTERQRRRIGKSHAERRSRVRAQSREQVEPTGAAEQPALVLAHHGRELLVELGSGKIVRGHPRRHLGDLVAGDRVVIQQPDIRLASAVIVAREPRDSALQRSDASGRLRTVAANIDQVLVVVSVAPVPQRYLIDRYLAAAALVPADVVLVLNKIDLLTARTRQEFEILLSSYREAGFSTAAISAVRGDGLSALRERLSGKTSVIVGQSGVGKSSLLKALLPDAQVRIGELSEGIGEGRHTTRTSRLYHLPEGGQLIDSPGVRGFDPGPLVSRDPLGGFREFAPYLGRCRFSDCTHTVEPGCAVRDAAEAGQIDPHRYESYVRLRREAEDMRER